MRAKAFRDFFLAPAAAVAACALAFDAWAQSYPSDIARSNSLAYGAWRRIVPGEYGGAAWIVSLDGTGRMLDRLTLRGKQFYAGKVCFPRDCGGNYVAFLIAADGSEASGLIDSRALGVGHRFFGSPDAVARRLLESAIRQ
jgi:hypothetical protein